MSLNPLVPAKVGTHPHPPLPRKRRRDKGRGRLRGNEREMLERTR